MAAKRNPAVIFDVDGTLVDVSSVRHHVLTGLRPDGTYNTQKDFDAFHREAVNCPPHKWVVDALNDWRAMGIDILIVTARSEKYSRQLDWWLAENNIECDAVRMRTNQDFRKDYLVKKDILAELERKWEVLHAYDDNPAVIRLWEENGIPTTIVPGWVE